MEIKCYLIQEKLLGCFESLHDKLRLKSEEHRLYVRRKGYA